MNFQQLKPDHCDGFVFIGVWVDQIGITEKNITDFEAYRVPVTNLADTVIQKLKKK
jgi:hypothetical protein